MPTDEERRKVAARLRELPIDMYEVEERWEAEGLDTDCHDQTDYFLIHNVLFGCLPAEHMHPCDYEELHCRLADLIEPEERTCRLTYDTVHDDMVCSSCGAWLDMVAYSELETSGQMRYCPVCGAKVVDEDA
jgi:hypothetical protein